MNYKNFLDKASKHCSFTKKEWTHFATITLVLAFIFSFNDWGTNVFNFQEGIKNFILAIVIAGISILVHHGIQRLTAIHYGYKPKHKTIWFGLIIGLFVAFITNGNLPILIGSALGITFLPKHRIGKFRFGVNLKTYGIIAFSGPVANIVLAGIIKIINFSANSVFLDKLIIFNILFAVYNLIPIPPLDGGYILWASRMLYAFTAGLLLSFTTLYLILNLSLILSIFIALIFAVICFVTFFLFLEIKWG